MLEGTLSVYAFILIFPLAVLGGLLFLIRNYIRTTESCDSDVKFEGKTIVVTGGSSGLGRALATELARRGARVVVACRTKARRDSTAFFLRSKTGSFNVRTMYMDLTSLDSVYDFCRDIADSEEKIDAIVNNAGTLCSQEKSADELDLMHAVNYVGHFLMVNLLLENLKKQNTAVNPCRIINVVCSGIRSGRIPTMDDLEGKAPEGVYSMRVAYRSSKVAMHLFSKELSRKFTEEGIVAVSVDPGYVNTGLYRHLEGFCGQMNQRCAIALYRTPDEGIQTILHCLHSKDVLNESGKLFKDCKAQDVRSPEWTESSIKQLWDRTCELIESKGLTLILKPEDEEEEEEEEMNGKVTTGVVQPEE